MSMQEIPDPVCTIRFSKWHFLDDCSVNQLAFSQTKNLLAISYQRQKYVRIWDTQTHSQQPITCLNHEECISSLVWDEDGKYLYTSVESGIIYRWRFDGKNGYPERLDIPLASCYPIKVFGNNMLIYIVHYQARKEQTVILLDIETRRVIGESTNATDNGTFESILHDEEGSRLAISPGAHYRMGYGIDGNKEILLIDRVDGVSKIPIRNDETTSLLMWHSGKLLYGLSDKIVYCNTDPILTLDQIAYSILIADNNILLIGTKGTTSSSIVVVHVPNGMGNWIGCSVIKRIDGFFHPVGFLAFTDDTKQFVITNTNNYLRPNTTIYDDPEAPCILDFGAPNLGRGFGSYFIDKLPV